MGVDKQPDLTKLTSEQRDKLEVYQQRESQLQALEDIANMTQEVVNLLDDQKKDKKVDNLGVLLTDIRESLATLKDKEAPETPDYAKPVVDAVSKLEKALSASIKAINFKPEIKVDAPEVNVSPPDVDLRGVEKVLGTLPKAFEQAIKLIPKTEIPEQDFAPLLSAWEGISEQLESIDTATRMKPLPGSMSINNFSTLADELQADNPNYAAFQFDPDDDAPNYIGKHADPDADDDDLGWVIYKFTYSGANVTIIKKKAGAWSGRVALFA